MKRVGSCTRLGSLAVGLALAAAATGAATAPAASARAPLPTGLEQTLERFARAHPTFPGVAVAVRARSFAWSGAVGLADRASGTPLESDAPFRIASVTKTFVAASILRLVEDHKLRLDDAIARYLSPATVALLRQGGYDVNAIRIRNLLQHTSGLYDYAEDQAYQAFVFGHPRHRWTRAEQLRFAITHGKPLSPPGTQFHYADTGYIVLGEILERRTGRSLASAYRTLVGFDRLGLRHTYLETLEPAPVGLRAPAHQYFGATDTTSFDPSFDLYGGGGLVSTVDDLARFYRALFAGRVYERPETLRTMLGKTRPSRPGDLGMGIFNTSIGRESCWHHDGFWGTNVIHCPASGVTIAITLDQAQNFDAAVQQFDAQILQLVEHR
jgi:D-alanyl-D-alanine carboxypeptidase